MNIEKLKKKIIDNYYLEGGFSLGLINGNPCMEAHYQLEIIEYDKNGYTTSTLFKLTIVKGSTEDFVRLRIHSNPSEESIKNIEKKVLKDLRAYMSFQYDSRYNTFWGDLNMDCKNDDVFNEFIELMTKELFEFCKEELD